MNENNPQIQVDYSDLRTKLDSLGRSQIPFATALALTKISKEIQGELRSGLDGKFKIRSSWLSRGITIIPARKSDWPYCQAEVGSRDKFMELQEFGGEKTALRHSLSVPINARGPGQMGTLPPSRWPSRLLKKKGYFIKETKSGNKALFGPDLSGDIGGIKMIYLFQRRVRVNARWNLRDVSSERVSSSWNRIFGTALGQAIASSR